MAAARLGRVLNVTIVCVHLLGLHKSKGPTCKTIFSISQSMKENNISHLKNALLSLHMAECEDKCASYTTVKLF